MYNNIDRLIIIANVWVETINIIIQIPSVNWNGQIYSDTKCYVCYLLCSMI